MAAFFVFRQKAIFAKINIKIYYYEICAFLML